VRGEPVALDHQALLGPSGVELALGPDPVDRRAWEAVVLHEREETALEQAAGDGLAVAPVVRQDRSDRARPASPRVARQQRIERGRAAEPAELPPRRTRPRGGFRPSTLARSNRVRAGVVTGIPRSIVTSSAGSTMRRASIRGRVSRRGEITSTTDRALAWILQRAAADRPASTVSGPLASTAAIHDASARSAR
jgi:hypothetical protein